MGFSRTRAPPLPTPVSRGNLATGATAKVSTMRDSVVALARTFANKL